MLARRLGIIVNIALVAGLVGCGADLETSNHGSCAGKCDDTGLWIDPSDFNVRPEISFAEDGQTITLTGELVNDGQTKSHLYPLYALPGMEVDIEVEVKGFNWGRVAMYEPPELPWALDGVQPVQSAFVEHGGQRHKLYWERTRQKTELNPLRRSPSGGVDEQRELSLKPMGLHALVVGPRMAEAYTGGERWTYTVKITCTQYCTPTVPKQRTRFPIYYAHGFNTDESSWYALFGKAINKVDRGWRTWARFNTVPGDQQLALRANRLRLHLTNQIKNMEELHRRLPGAYPKDPETPYWRLNIVAHSMGGIDARTLIGDPRANELCELGDAAQKICPGPGAGGLGDGEEGLKAGGKTFCCLDARNLPTSCCAPDEHGNPTLPWRQVIASVTTLSTPHHGSPFADAGLAFIASDPLLREQMWDLPYWIKDKILDLAEQMFPPGYGQNAILNTLTNLSRPFAAALNQRLPGPPAGRKYSWACATNPTGSCEDPHHDQGQPGIAHAPRPGGLLPAPLADNTTVFSWASQTCIGFNNWFGNNCPDTPSEDLHLIHQVMNAMDAGPNDGVVSIESAKWGIYMGDLWRDHYDWCSAEPDFAVFHTDWLERLRRSGY